MAVKLTKDSSGRIVVSDPDKKNMEKLMNSVPENLREIIEKIVLERVRMSEAKRKNPKE